MKIPDVNKYDHFVNELRYYPIIFMTPPWREIFCEDSERKNSFENAVEEYKRLLEHYDQYGYELVILPKISVCERYQFILDEIKGHRHGNIAS